MKTGRRSAGAVLWLAEPTSVFTIISDLICSADIIYIIFKVHSCNICKFKWLGL